MPIACLACSYHDHGAVADDPGKTNEASDSMSRNKAKQFASLH